MGSCIGCQPRLALDGLRLCHFHRSRIATDAVSAAGLYEELVDRLAGAGAGTGGRERVTVTADRGLSLNDSVVDHRDTIRAVLASWSDMITQERGITPPRFRVRDHGAFVAHHASWLAAHETARDASGELADLVRTGRRLLSPGRGRSFAVGRCPSCRSELRAVLVEGRPGRLVCATGHEWPMSRARRLAAAMEA